MLHLLPFIYLLHIFLLIYYHSTRKLTLENCQCCCDHDYRQIETREVIGHPMAAISH